MTFILILLINSFIAEGVKGINLLIAMLVVFPFPLVTVPCLGMALYLSSNKRPRVTNILAIMACAIVLLSLLVPGMNVIMVFFLSSIIVGTPLGLILIPVLIVILAFTQKKEVKGRKFEPPPPSAT